MHTAAVTASQNQASITMGWTSRSPADSLSFYGKAATCYTLIAVALKATTSTWMSHHQATIRPASQRRLTAWSYLADSYTLRYGFAVVVTLADRFSGSFVRVPVAAIAWCLLKAATCNWVQ